MCRRNIMQGGRFPSGRWPAIIKKKWSWFKKIFLGRQRRQYQYFPSWRKRKKRNVVFSSSWLPLNWRKNFDFDSDFLWVCVFHTFVLLYSLPLQGRHRQTRPSLGPHLPIATPLLHHPKSVSSIDSVLVCALRRRRHQSIAQFPTLSLFSLSIPMIVSVCDLCNNIIILNWLCWSAPCPTVTVLILGLWVSSLSLR